MGDMLSQVLMIKQSAYGMLRLERWCLALLKATLIISNQVMFSPDGKCVASGSADRTIRVWDIGTGEIVSGPLEGHTKAH